MTDMWKLLYESLARREEYATLSETDVFPLPFCPQMMLQKLCRLRAFKSIYQIKIATR